MYVNVLMVSPGKTVRLIATAVANMVYVIPLIIHAVYVIKDFNSTPSKKSASLIVNVEILRKNASDQGNVRVKMIAMGMEYAVMNHVPAIRDMKEIRARFTPVEKLITILYLA